MIRKKPPFNGTQLNRNHPLSNGLVGAWLFNEGEVNRVYDTSGRGAIGFVLNPGLEPYEIGPHQGWALTFTGNDTQVTIYPYNFVEVSNYLDPALMNTSAVTFSGWFKFTGTPGTNTMIVGAIQDWGGWGSDGGCGVVLTQRDAETIENPGGELPGFEFTNSKYSFTGNDNINAYTIGFRCAQSGTLSLAKCTAGLFADTWYHFAVVYAQGHGTEFYLNGEFINYSAAFSGAIDFSNYYTFENPARIGVDNQLTNYLQGAIDSVYWYNRALTESEVYKLWEKPYDQYEQNNEPLMAAFSISETSTSNTYNEVGSGGIYANGTATISKRTTPAVTGGAWANGTATISKRTTPAVTGGAWANGTATVARRSAVTITAAGTWANGAATVSKRTTPAVTGGAWANGTATVARTGAVIIAAAGVHGAGSSEINSRLSQTASGGSYGSGSATAYSVLTPTVVAAGVWGSSSATNSEVDIIVVAPAGVIGASSATAATVLNPFITPAGIWGNSTADARGTFSVSPSGGSYASGSGVVGGVYSHTASGGSYGQGDATRLWIASPVVSGGSNAAGDATHTINIASSVVAAGLWANGTGTGGSTNVYNQQVVPAGVVINGTASDSARFSPVITAAGALGAGDASAGVRINSIVITAAGALGAGAATITTSYTPAVAPAGVYAAGTGAGGGNTYNLSITPAGVYAAGSATGVFVLSPSVSGGSSVAGLATDSVRLTSAITGGSYGAGSAGNTGNFVSPVVAAGAVMSGAAVATEVDNGELPASGVQGAGSATLTAIYQTVVTGGSSAAGSAVATANYVVVAAGGSSAAGSAANSGVFNVAATGGAWCNATASVSLTSATGGGVIVDGSATLGVVTTRQMTGGSLAGGSAQTGSFGDIIITGGVSVGGTGLASFQFIHVVTGGTVAGSGILPGLSYNPPVSGGSVAAGQTSPRFTYSVATTGGAIAGGTVFTVIESSVTGGAIAGGSALLSGTGNAYIPTGGVWAGGSARMTGSSSQPVSGGAVLSGSADANQSIYSYLSTGEFVDISGTAQVRPLGFYATAASGGVTLASEAVTVYGFRVFANGEVLVAGQAVAAQPDYKTSSRGYPRIGVTQGAMVVMSGDVSSRFSPYSHTAKGLAASLNGKAEVSLVKKPLICEETGCKSPRGNDCPNLDFYYEKKEVKDPKRTRGMGAFVPTITACRQKIPDSAKTRRRPRPRKKSG